MQHLSQTIPVPTVAPTPWVHGHVPTPGTATAGGWIIRHPTAWPYTGGVSRHRISRSPVAIPVSVGRGRR